MTNSEVNPIYEQIIENIANQKYAVCDHFFDKQEVMQLRQNLIEKKEREDFRQAAIGSFYQEKIVKTIRGDSILWINEQEKDIAESLFFDKINDFIRYLNRTCFMGITESEFHYAMYPRSTFYKKHLDIFNTDDCRALSIVLYLNDEDWKPEYGGALRLYLNAAEPDKILDILPLAGRLAIFDSRSMEHEVKEVFHTRYSITGWLKTRSLHTV